MKFPDVIINLLNIIRRKGLIETGLLCLNSLLGVVITKVKIFWLRIRGYDIDFSVCLRGTNTFFQSTKNSIKVGKESVIGPNVKLSSGFGGLIVVKNRVGIFDYTIIDIHSRLEIGANTLISPFCYITDYDHVLRDKNMSIIKQGYKTSPIKIGKSVWLGAKVIVLKGITIGDNTVIGAGSVVTKDIPSDCVAVGNPARIIKKI